MRNLYRLLFIGILVFCACICTACSAQKSQYEESIQEHIAYLQQLEEKQPLDVDSLSVKRNESKQLTAGETVTNKDDVSGSENVDAYEDVTHKDDVSGSENVDGYEDLANNENILDNKSEVTDGCESVVKEQEETEKHTSQEVEEEVLPDASNSTTADSQEAAGGVTSTVIEAAKHDSQEATGGMTSAVIPEKSQEEASEMQTKSAIAGALIGGMQAYDVSKIVSSREETKQYDELQQQIIDAYNEKALPSNRRLTRAFKNCVIVGDSIAKGAREYAYLNDKIIFAKVGVSVASGVSLVDEALETNPKKVFITFGVNDIEIYDSNVNAFLKKYRKVIDKVKVKVDPENIYVTAIMPPQEGLIEQKPFYQYLDLYNTELAKFCEEQQINFVNCGFILREFPEMYERDGVHPKVAFYPLWFAYLAEVGGLNIE